MRCRYLTIVLSWIEKVVWYSHQFIHHLNKWYSWNFQVTIHNSLEYPGFERTYKIVSIGYSSYFQISAEKLTNTEDVQFLSKDRRKCVFSGETPLKYHKTYHFSNCMAEKYSHLIFLHCGCVPFYFTFSGRDLKVFTLLCIILKGLTVW